MSEDDYTPLAALQHAAFCPRQCALIHNDRLWSENTLTTMGKIEHERVEDGQSTRHGDRLTARSVRLINHHLRIHGVSDVVEYQYQPHSHHILAATPVEYKHGKEKTHDADRIQLCAQALCLEEMHQIHIPEAYLFYQRTRRRLTVAIDEDLRRLTQHCIMETQSLLSSRILPPAQRTPACKSCSLESECLPTKIKHSASEYNRQMLL